MTFVERFAFGQRVARSAILIGVEPGVTDSAVA